MPLFHPEYDVPGIARMMHEVDALSMEARTAKEKGDIEKLESERDDVLRLIEEMKEEHSGDEGLLTEVINDKGNISKADLQKRIKEIRNDKEAADELEILLQYENLMAKEALLLSSRLL